MCVSERHLVLTLLPVTYWLGIRVFTDSQASLEPEREINNAVWGLLEPDTTTGLRVVCSEAKY